jgi:HD superfamily phosphohydrolase
MPTWGLTPEQRKLAPWGLHWTLLEPRKVTTDEVWGDVHTTVVEQVFIDTAPMQRLRRVRQLGNSHLVYPGATHTRFSHSMGALKVVQDLLDAVIAQRDGLHPVDDLLRQWEQRDEPKVFERKIAEVIVLGRLGALLHDLGHVPFGHSIEDDLKVLVSHDKNADRFDEMWQQIEQQVPELLERHFPTKHGEHYEEALRSLLGSLGEHGHLYRDLRPLIISKDKLADDRRKEDRDYPFVEDLVGDTICADLLDYLLRDHQNTGLPASLGWRFTAAFFAVPEGRGPLSKRAALNLMRDGHERTDVVSELLKALRYRYELNERVLYHHAKLSADAMIGKALELWADAVWLEDAADDIGALDNAEDLVEAQEVARLRAGVEGRVPTKKWREFERARQLRLEQEFLAHGDDGLLERIQRLVEEEPESDFLRPLVGELNRQAASLASAVLGRELFTVAGRVGLQDAPAHQLYDCYGSASARVTLQNEAQRFAELGREPQVLLWLPSPKMRLKLARVLVDDGVQISEFNRFEDVRGRRGDDIYRADRALWALWVFVRRDVSIEDREVILVYLADRLGVAWEKLRERYGNSTSTWLPRWGLMEVLDEDGPTAPTVEQAMGEAPTISHRGDLTTRLDYLAHLRSILDIAPLES